MNETARGIANLVKEIGYIAGTLLFALAVFLFTCKLIDIDLVHTLDVTASLFIVIGFFCSIIDKGNNNDE